MNNLSQKQMNQFIRYIPLLEPQEFIGLAKLLGVEIVEQSAPKFNEDNKVNFEVNPRQFTDILENMLENFKKSNRKRRREFMKLLGSATKHKTLSAADRCSEGNEVLPPTTSEDK